MTREPFTRLLRNWFPKLVWVIIFVGGPPADYGQVLRKVKSHVRQAMYHLHTTELITPTATTTLQPSTPQP